MASFKEMEDGTYSIVYVLKMNMALQYKAEQLKANR